MEEGAVRLPKILVLTYLREPARDGEGSRLALAHAGRADDGEEDVEGLRGESFWGRGCEARFPPGVGHRLLLSAPTAAIE